MNIASLVTPHQLSMAALLVILKVTQRQKQGNLLKLIYGPKGAIQVFGAHPKVKHLL